MDIIKTDDTNIDEGLDENEKPSAADNEDNLENTPAKAEPSIYESYDEVIRRLKDDVKNLKKVKKQQKKILKLEEKRKEVLTDIEKKRKIELRINEKKRKKSKKH